MSPASHSSQESMTRWANASTKERLHWLCTTTLMAPGVIRILSETTVDSIRCTIRSSGLMSAALCPKEFQPKISLWCIPCPCTIIQMALAETAISWRLAADCTIWAKWLSIEKLLLKVCDHIPVQRVPTLSKEEDRLVYNVPQVWAQGNGCPQEWHPLPALSR